MRGEISSAKFAKRHPLDWYVEQGWEWEQIVDAIGLEPEVMDCCTIWDPCCGYGHSLSRLQGVDFRGDLIASDVVNNVAWGDFEDATKVRFFSNDFLDYEPQRLSTPTSIWCNPPFSYKKVNGEIISQAFVRQALKLATHRVVMLLPLKWLAGQARGKFLREHPPQQVLYFTQRPSMPPGDRIKLMGNRAYSGGMVDYCAVVWDVRAPTAPGDTRSVWLPRLGER
ncbi:MAG: hypothetical protein ABL914_10975 [Novosphingobium sp.]|uniref:hypothetical protein n=1 Tax=Novosphingobium sp. TaxID=1874826 RepID=UPI0032BC6828